MEDTSFLKDTRNAKLDVNELWKEPEIRWEVLDPRGLKHIVVRTVDGYWHGLENLGTEFGSPQTFRALLRNSIMDNPDCGVRPNTGHSWLRL